MSEQRHYITHLNEAFARIAGWSFDHRWIVLALSAVLLFVSIVLAGRTRIDNSYEAYFDPDDPIYQAYLNYRDDFGSDEVSYLMYEVPDAEYGPWDLEVMGKIAQLTRALEDEVPFIYEVTSLTNAELIEGVPGGLEINELWDEPPQTQEELLEYRERFLNKPLYVGGLLNEDAHYGAISIKMDRTSTDPLEDIRLDPDGGDGLGNLYPQVTGEKVEEIIARPEYAGIRFYHSGDVPLNYLYNRIIEREGGFLPLISSGVIGLILAFFFRSFIGVAGPLVIIQLSVIVAVAVVGLLGWRLDLMFGSVPNLLTAVAVAHSVHILSEFRLLFAELGDRREALVRTLYLVGAPCLLTSLTTGVGFLSLIVSPIAGISHMAVYSAVGVIAAFLLSITLLTVLLSFGRRTPRQRTIDRVQVTSKGGEAMKHLLVAIAGFVIRQRGPILVGFGVLLVVSIAGITRLSVDSNWLLDFSERVKLKAATAKIDDVMGGMANLVYVFDTGEQDGIKDPAVLREIERVQQKAEEQDYLVKKSYSIVDILKDLNQALHDGDPAWYRLPETREEVAQYLILYEGSGGDEVEEYVTLDFARANLELRLRITNTSYTAKLVDAIDAYLAEAPVVHSELRMTGIGALWLKLLDYITVSQVNGFLLAFSVIAVMMMFIFGSVKTGLISMAPNLAPVFLTLGAMGWLGVPLDYSKLMIATVAIGIAVDDTIHLVSRYHHEFRLCGDYRKALIEAMSDVGRALLITSAALVCGFLVFLLSVLDAKANFGILLASTIVAALIADFLLMPALVLTFHPFGPEGERVEAETREAA
jgi:predicted RND superfamily exporter protein